MRQASRRATSKNSKSLVTSYNDKTLIIEEIFEILRKTDRNICDNKILVNFMVDNMKDFCELLKKNNTNYKDILIVISLYIKYEFFSDNKIIFHYGNIGDTFYLILKGRVNILVPYPKVYELTFKEYIDFLTILQYFKEHELVLELIDKNKNEFETSEDELKTYFGRNLRRFSSFISTYVYQEKLQPMININSKDERKKVSLYIFVSAKTLKDGNFFGDIALDTSSSRRTATVITDGDCHFATMSRSQYISSLQETNSKSKKNNIINIFSTPLFNSLNANSRNFYQRVFGNLFTTRKVDRGEIIIKENDEPVYLYFVKSGQYEVSLNMNILEIIELIKYFGGNVEDYKSKYELAYENVKLYNFMKQKKIIKICIVNDKDVIGLSDLIYKGKFIFKVTSLTDGELLTLESKNIDSLLSDKKVKSNYNNFIKTKISFMVEQLNMVKNIKMQTYYNLNNEHKPIFTRNLPDSLIGTYFEPNLSKKANRARNELSSIKKINTKDNGPIEICFIKNKNDYTKNFISEVNPEKSATISFSREYITTECSSPRNVFDPLANFSLRRKNYIKYESTDLDTMYTKIYKFN